MGLDMYLMRGPAGYAPESLFDYDRRARSIYSRVTGHAPLAIRPGPDIPAIPDVARYALPMPLRTMLAWYPAFHVGE